MANQLAFAVILTALVGDGLAWSPQSSQWWQAVRNSDEHGSCSRRNVIGNVGAIAAAALGVVSFPIDTAQAASTDPAAFATYSILPDPSARLDPKLRKVDVSFSTELGLLAEAISSSFFLIHRFCTEGTWFDKKTCVIQGWRRHLARRAPQRSQRS